jgi:CDP-glycerol glycerophosphotransferase
MIGGTLKNIPLVSVIIISYNDAAHLPNAIRSVLNQTLFNLEVIVCDDCSMDDTTDVVQEFMRNDSRVRYERLEANSGGCGAPRNRGINSAGAPYIFFLDSDDVLDRHALKNLYNVASHDNCDFVMGKTIRYNLASKHKQAWLGYLFREDVHNTSILRHKELLNDTLSTNKLYKKSFIINNKLYFEEGTHYEDIIYTALVFSKAKKLSVIQDEVYIWKVYDENVKKSITAKRDSIGNLKDRLYANECRAQIYAELNDPEIDRLCHMHFLKHSVMLYLMDASDYEDAYLDKIIGLLRPVITKIPEELFGDLDVQNRVIYAMLLQKDKQGLRELSYYRKYGNKFAGKIIEKNKRFFWASSKTTVLSRNKLIKDLMDISDYRLADTPVSSLTYYHELKRIYRRGGSLVLEGISQDPLGKFDFGTSLDAQHHYLTHANKGHRQLPNLTLPKCYE